MNDVQKLLRIVRGEDAPDDPPQAGTPAAGTPAPLARLQGGRMKSRERALATLRFRATRARAAAVRLAGKRATVVRGLRNGKPPSFQEQCDYAASRRPAPGRTASLDERSEIVFQAVIGRPGVAAGNAISAISARRMRSASAFAFAFLVAVPSLCIAGLTAAAVWLAAVVLALATLIFLALRYWPSRPAHLPEESD